MTNLSSQENNPTSTVSMSARALLGRDAAALKRSTATAALGLAVEVTGVAFGPETVVVWLLETGHPSEFRLDVGVGLVLRFRGDRVNRIDGHGTIRTLRRRSLTRNRRRGGQSGRSTGGWR